VADFSWTQTGRMLGFGMEQSWPSQKMEAYGFRDPWLGIGIDSWHPGL